MAQYGATAPDDPRFRPPIGSRAGGWMACSLGPLSLCSATAGPDDGRVHTRWFGASATGWFVVIAIGWTWSFGFVAVALGGTAGRVAHLLALLGPLLAWLAVLLARSGTPERRAFLRRVFDVRRVRPLGWVAVVAVGAGLPGTAAALSTLAGGTAALDPDVTVMSLLGVVGFALAAGLAEEPGWRGIAQDGFEQSAGRWRSAVVLGVLWSLWHLPLYIIAGTYQHGLGVGTVEFWGSMVIRVPLAVLLVWLVASSSGAIVAAVAAHALGNTTGELLATDRTTSLFELLLTAVAAAAVVIGCLRRDPARATGNRPPGEPATGTSLPEAAG